VVGSVHAGGEATITRDALTVRLSLRASFAVAVSW
jgi:hypothetical protein